MTGTTYRGTVTTPPLVHSQVQNRDGAVVGCTCLDRVFYAYDGENWDTHTSGEWDRSTPPNRNLSD